MERTNAGTMTPLLIALGLALPAAAGATATKTAYPTTMAPLQQYLMADRNAEVAMARSAAPASVGRDAEVLVLTARGYERAAAGKNGFVCLVMRSWDAGADEVEFWNPAVRSPICLNAAAARTVLPLTIKRAELALAGRSKDQLFSALTAAIDHKELPALEPGAMCYMMSKQGHLSDQNGHWRPHLMFFTPRIKPAAWGADAADSPLMAFESAEEHMTVFLMPVATWSDGTPAPAGHH